MCNFAFSCSEIENMSSPACFTDRIPAVILKSLKLAIYCTAVTGFSATRLFTNVSLMKFLFRAEINI